MIKAAWDFRRSAASARLLVELAHEHGIPPAQSLEQTGIDAAALAEPSTEIEARQELQLIRNVVQALPQIPALGLAAGTRYHLTAYGIWGFALISSPTLRSAIDVALRYLDLTFAFNRMALEEDGRELRLVLDDRDIPEDVRRFCVERDVAAILTIQRELLGKPIVLRSLALRLSRPPYASRLPRLFGVQPSYAAPRNVAAFDARLLDLPLPQANALTARACEEQCRRLLGERRMRGGLGGQVRDRLLREPGGMPDMETVSAELSITSRTLRRRLLDEGTSYRALQDEVREALAMELLGTARLSIEDIAERLGYAETSSFIHAFKRWKGVPPGALRA